jgi:two-component system, NarL family, response regulator NreC
MGTVRILIADDHALIRRGLRALLVHEPSFDVVAEASDGGQAVEAAQRELPHVAVLDIGMPNLNSIEAGRRISAADRSVQLVMLTVYSDEGKAFFSPKVSRILADDYIYIRFVKQEQVEDSYELLTDHERQILQLLAEGLSNKDIATILNLSPTTVICHRQHIFRNSICITCQP